MRSLIGLDQLNSFFFSLTWLPFIVCLSDTIIGEGRKSATELSMSIGQWKKFIALRPSFTQIIGFSLHYDCFSRGGFLPNLIAFSVGFSVVDAWQSNCTHFVMRNGDEMSSDFISAFSAGATIVTMDWLLVRLRYCLHNFNQWLLPLFPTSHWPYQHWLSFFRHALSCHL